MKGTVTAGLGLLAAVLVSIWATSCSDDVAATDDADADAEAPLVDVPPADLPPPTELPLADSCDPVRHVARARQVSWPGGGTELTLRVTGEGGEPLGEDVAACLELEVTGGASHTMRTSPGGSYIALVLRREGRADLEAAVAAFLATRPTGERVALYGWEQELVQIANFTRDHTRLAAQAGRYLARAPTEAPPVAAAALRGSLAKLIGEIGGEGPRALRSVVVFASSAPGAPVPGAPAEAATWLWVVAGADGVDEATKGHVVPWQDHADPAAALLEASARLDAFATHAFYNIGICHDPAGAQGSLTVGGSGSTIPLALEETPEDEHALPCDPALVAAGVRPYPRRLELLLTPAQLEVYAARQEAASRDDFDLTLRLWPDGEPAEATAHLRGKSSYSCERRNYAVNLKGSRPRHLLPGTANDEYYLISMCRDDGYVNQTLGDRLMRTLGLFPAPFRLVELWLNGETRGVYLLVDKAAESLVLHNAGVTTIIRRANDAHDVPYEVKYALVSDAASRAEYDDLLTSVDGLSGLALLEHLEAHLDLESYLRWIAFNVMVQNGDYIDEIYFYATPALGLDGATLPHFDVMGWDPDDMFSPCHHNGDYAIVDDNGLLYCTESDLEKAMLADPVVYARYVDVLEAVLRHHASAAVVTSTAAAVREELLPFFDDPAVAAAMVELVELNPKATDPAVAKAEIETRLSELEELIADRRVVLLDAIAAYRAKHE